ncbi:MAG: hypothetical protein WCV91_03365 [Candidatus Margulisiibacteriota bacterium]
MNKERITKAIADRNRVILAFLALAKEKVFLKLSEEEKINLVNDVILEGEDVASWALSEYKTNDPRKIASSMGLRIFGEEKKELKKSEYRPEKKEIAISRRFHEKILQKFPLSNLSEHVLKIIVAHELFHHIEIDRVGKIYKKHPITVFKLGPIAIKKQIRGLSEVAAQAFTHKLLSLKLSPEVFDYLLLTSF